MRLMLISGVLMSQVCVLPNLLAQNPYQQAQEPSPYAQTSTRHFAGIPGLEELLENLRPGEQVVIVRKDDGYDLRRESIPENPDNHIIQGALVQPRVERLRSVGGSDLLNRVPTREEFLEACTPRAKLETHRCSVVYCNHVFFRMGETDVLDCIRHQTEQKRRQNERR